MICPKCGRELPGDTEFCPSCQGAGTKLLPSTLRANVKALVSLALGIISLFGMNLLFGLFAVILGISSRKRCDKPGIATAGIVCGMISVSIYLVVGFIFRQVGHPGP